MSLVIFICPKNQYLSKYCEAFYNHINSGMNRRTSTYSAGTWGSSATTSSPKSALARLPMRKNQSDRVPMRASDPALERIYRKVISGECYDHTYYRITEEELNESTLVIYIADNGQPVRLPQYLRNVEVPVVTWKFSNVNNDTDQKYVLIETLIRKMLRT